MKSSIRNEPKSVRDIAYYRQRYRNRVFSKLVTFISEQAQRERLTKKDIAERLNKDPGQISRLLNQPGNLTLDTISDLLLAFDAEADPPEIFLFNDRRAANYMHPLIARALKLQAQASDLQAKSSPAGAGELTPPRPKFETSPS
jgi:transcriptional regulator with XRE-family HTH domain